MAAVVLPLPGPVFTMSAGRARISRVDSEPESSLGSGLGGGVLTAPESAAWA